MIFRLYFILAIIFLSGCKTATDYKKNYHNSSELAFDLLKQCVDTMLNTNPTINTKNYVLDLSSIDTLNKKGIDSFLSIKNTILPTTLHDSTMIFNDSNHENFNMKQSMIVKIETISFKSDRKTIVTASKLKSTNEIIDATIELERFLSGYIIRKFWVNK
jgi:hypothetical protein